MKNQSFILTKVVPAGEFILLFGGLPTALYFDLIPVNRMTVLLIVAVVTLAYTLITSSRREKAVFSIHVFRKNSRLIRIILLRLLVSVPVLILLTLLINPDKLFILPDEQTLRWLSTLLVYPVLSAVSQEIIYRLFFFHRYKVLFPGKNMILVSTFAFSFMHIIFENMIAVALTLVGGYIFSRTYARSRSFWITSLEHSVYGSIVFTLGLGQYFI